MIGAAESMIHGIWYFLVYSLLGFLLEVAFAALTRQEKRDRKCRLLLPLCPVYGLGVVAVLSLPGVILHRPVLLYLCGVLVATGVEYLSAIFYETVWGVHFWDYSHLPGSASGRVCLPFSLAWGMLLVPVIYFVHPLVARLVAALPSLLLLPVGLLFLVDTIVTGQILRLTRTTDSLRWYRAPGLAKPAPDVYNKRDSNSFVQLDGVFPKGEHINHDFKRL